MRAATLIGVATSAAQILVATSAAHANPRPLPMTYTTDTQAPGNAELELFVDMIPLRAISPTTTEETSYLASGFSVELEIGLAERLELGLYATFVPSLGDQLAGTGSFPGLGNGMKQRLRYTLNPEPDSIPIIGNAGVYVEVAENEREIEFEAKLLLEKRLAVGSSRLRIAANLSAEYELYFSGQREWVLNPSAGGSYEITPSAHIGLDGFLRAEYPTNPKPDARTFGLGPHIYMGPAVLLAFDKVWWSFGAYGRLTSTGHDLEPGEPYGRIWFRSVVGFDL